MAEDYTLEHFRVQVGRLRKIGMVDMVGHLPGLAELVREDENPEATARRLEAMLNAMTEAERREPDLIDLDAQRRITVAAGVESGEVERFLAGFAKVRALMRRTGEMSIWQRLKMVMGFGSVAEDGG